MPQFPEKPLGTRGPHTTHLSNGLEVSSWLLCHLGPRRLPATPAEPAPPARSGMFSDPGQEQQADRFINSL